MLTPPVKHGREEEHIIKLWCGNFLRHDFSGKREFAILYQDHGHALLRDTAARLVSDDTRDTRQIFCHLQRFPDGFGIIRSGTFNRVGQQFDRVVSKAGKRILRWGLVLGIGTRQ